jgi:enoyl-CoA hydratase
MDRAPHAHARRDGELAIVTLDRPPVNAVDHRWILDVTTALASPMTAAANAVVVVSSCERAFCAGADLKEQLDDATHSARADAWVTLLATIRAMPVPVVAVIRGACVGGGMGLAAQCDLRLATPSASFALPEIRVGRAGGASHLRRFVSEGRVRRIMFTGEAIDAATAAEWGFVDEVVPEAGWWESALDLVARISVHGRESLTLLKQALDASERAGVERGYALEQDVTRAMRERGLARSDGLDREAGRGS